jgi:hypothetical protein
LSAPQRALKLAGKRLLRSDPRRPGVLEVAKDTWPLQVLRLPLGASEVVYEVEEFELLVRLHELGTKWTSQQRHFPLFRGPLSLLTSCRRTGSMVDPGCE